MESRTPTFSGYQRQRKTRFSVRFSEICSRLLITLGGIGTIVAIILVCVFLVWVAVPLMFGSKSHSRPTVTTTWKEKPLAVGMDEDQLLGWILLPDGTLVGYRLDNGTQVSSEKLFPELQITAVSPPNRNNQLLLGFEDGTMSLGTIQVEATIVPEEQNKPDLNSISVGIAVIQKNSLMTRRANGQLISLSVKASFDTPMVVSPDKPLRLLDISHRPSGPIIASLAADGILRVSDVYETKNLITGKVTRKLTSGEFNLGKSNQFPDYLFVNGVGDNVYLLWKTGTLRRINIQDIMNPAIVQDLQVVPDRVQVTAAQFLIGKATLLIGDSRGTVSAWFRIRPPGYTQGDASILQNAHKYQASSASVTALATSSRSRILGT
ncbi:MAG TPA: hypothetical protein PKA06_06980, partial [Gemmatales bacterium]|nr:hypothetical protein [Gemmatales bacterium]